jgi:hypothetical protein
MASNRFRFDLSQIRISDEEILADLAYPARPRTSRYTASRRRRRLAPRRGR